MDRELKITKRSKIIILVLFIIMNIIFRYPTTPHQIGWDTYIMQILINSLTNNGHALWWSHPLAIFGLYPLSEVSSMPFFVSGISQLTGLESDPATFYYSLGLGIAGIFFAYALAGAIWDNDYFKLLVALVFTTSQGILLFTTWNATTRSLFIMMLPVFIYSLIKINSSKKFIPIFITFFIFSLATHQMTYFTVPFIISFIILKYSYKLKDYIFFKHLNVILMFFLILAFFLPFFDRGLMESLPRGYGGSRYGFILSTLIPSYVRYIGPLLLFGFSSVIYLIFKNKRTFGENFILLTSIMITPLLYITTYMKNFILFFGAVLIGFGLMNVINTVSKSKKFYNLISLFIILSILFSGYYQFMHDYSGFRSQNRYIPESEYSTALWIKDNINKPIASGERIVGISGAQSILIGTGAASISLGMTSIDQIEISENPVFSSDFFKYGPYQVTPHTVSTGYYASKITEVEYNRARSMLNKFNLSYVVESIYYNNKMTKSIKTDKYQLPQIYDNGKNKIWVVK